MAHSSAVEMTNSGSLLSRMTAGVASIIEAEPSQFVQAYKWTLVSHDDWVAAWDKAKDDWAKFAAQYGMAQSQPDYGAMEDVITDEMINSAINEVVAAIATKNDTAPDAAEPSAGAADNSPADTQAHPAAL